MASRILPSSAILLSHELALDLADRRHGPGPERLGASSAENEWDSVGLHSRREV
jgi:hypothetical protein